jgi:hypothetical protein
MTRRDKLIAKIRAQPVEAEFADVRAVLEFFGWTEGRSSGSHHAFIKSGHVPSSYLKSTVKRSSATTSPASATFLDWTKPHEQRKRAADHRRLSRLTVSA